MTGSRDWADPFLVDVVLGTRLAEVSAAGGVLTVIHGDCPTGLDRMVKWWVGKVQRDRVRAWMGNRVMDQSAPVVEEPHPADWTKGRMAGFTRNQRMVDLGADECVGFFWRGAGNKGTGDCVRRARRAGIPVHTVWGGEPKPEENGLW